MAGQASFVHPCKEDFKSIEENLMENGRQYPKSKRSKLLLSNGVSNLNHSAEISQEKPSSENGTMPKWETETSKHVWTDSQESLRKILGTRKARNLREKFNFQDSDDSDEEEEQSIKGDPTEHETYKSSMKGILETLKKTVS